MVNINYWVFNQKKYPQTPEGQTLLLADIEYLYRSGQILGFGDVPSIQDLVDQGAITTTIGMGADVLGGSASAGASSSPIPGLGSGAGGGTTAGLEGTGETSPEQKQAIVDLLKKLANASQTGMGGGYAQLIGGLISGQIDWDSLSNDEKNGIITSLAAAGVLGAGVGLGAAGVIPALSPGVAGGAAGGGGGITAAELAAWQAAHGGASAAASGGASGGIIAGIAAKLGIPPAWLGIGGVYAGYKFIQDIAFGGFITEEAEQLAMFTEFFSTDDYLGLAATLNDVSLFLWQAGDWWAKYIGEPLAKIHPTVKQEIAFHEGYKRRLITYINKIQEAGAWKGLEYNPDTMEITNWGEPTSPEELKVFLDSQEGAPYLKYYEDSIQEMAISDPAKLYAYYYKGYLDWYTLPEWMRNDIDAYKNQLKNWQYDAQMGTLSGYDAIKLLDTYTDLLWYGEKDKDVINDALAAASLVQKMVENGELSSAKAQTYFDSLLGKLKNCDAAAGLYSVDANGKLVVKTLSDAELQKRFGTLTILSTQPELIFNPPGTDRTHAFDLSFEDRVKEIGENKITEYREEVEKKTGVTMGEGTGILPTDPEAYAAGSFPGAPGGPMGQLEPEFKTPTAGPEATAAKMTDAEFYWLKAIQDGKRTEDELKKLWPDVYASLQSKGKLPSQTGGVTTPTTPTTNILAQILGGGISTPATPTDLYSYRPEKGWTVEALEKALASGNLSPTQRATATQQLDILRRSQSKKYPEGGFTGARVPGQKAPMTERQAGYVEKYLTAAVEKGYSSLSQKDISQVKSALQRRSSGGEMLLEDFENPDALEAAMAALNYTFYPATKERYGGVWGGGKPIYRQSES